MKPLAMYQFSLRAFLIGGVALTVLSSYSMAETRDVNCRPDGKNEPNDCVHYNGGTVISRSAQPNVSNEGATPLGDVGFSISVEDGTGDAAGAPRTIAGVKAKPLPQRNADRALDTRGIDLTYDGLGARPRLAISTNDMRESYRPNETVTFRASSNYPAWIAKSEVVITDIRGRTVAVVPIAPNGTANWQMPPAAQGQSPDGEFLYYLRASNQRGQRDETRSLPLARSNAAMAPELTNRVYAAAEGEDMTARRSIPVVGGAITVSGQSVTGQPVQVMGETIATDGSRSFVVQRILPPGMHSVAISVDGRRVDRVVTVESSEWFATGIADLTVGRNKEGSWKTGRLAGFAQGTLADGTRLTGSVDTQEEELRDMFRNFGRKNPDQTLRTLRSADVFNTFGDDSQTSELAPTSGKVFLRAEKDGSYAQWGDFKPLQDENLTVRSDRALYGLSGEYRSLDVTSQGDARNRVTGFAAQADTLTQRDVMRATGGSAYYLSRRDIQDSSETIFVELRSRTTGAVVERRRLTEGKDYRINPIQGVVILNGPLSAHSGTGGLISENPLGDVDVNLVAQYEYVPTTGEVDGYTAGARGETWVTDNLRLGASVVKETTGLADNELGGVDVLYKDGENRELSLEYATSSGPGFGTAFSLNGGFDIEETVPTYGRPGLRADAWRVEGRTDLAFAGLKGNIEAYFDRKEAGFTSPDESIQHDQKTAGFAGNIALSDATDLTFAGEGIRTSDGRREEKLRIGLDHRFDQNWQIEGEIGHDRRQQSGALNDYGSRTDAALRVTWHRDADLSIWALGQATLSRDDTRLKNDRIGIGAKARLNDKTDVTAEVSDGSLGKAGRLELGYRPNANTTTSIGYVVDPLRRYDASSFSGRDKGSIVFGATSRVSEALSYTTETNYSAFGTRPALTTGYGVTYSPDQRWQYDALLQYGTSREEGGSELQRRGLSLGVRYNEEDQLSAGLRAELLRENSNRPGNELDRDTWLLSGFYESTVSEDWRFISSVDAVISDSDQSAFRDGRYVEARFGYAWRPVQNDNFNALFSYTYLYDLPGADQVNLSGEINGPSQKSHILNVAGTWKVDPTWTLSAKYGYRMREAAERGTNDFTSSKAHLAVLRADYHIVHNWDVMGEVRLFSSPESGSKEHSALIGVYRHFGENLRIGGGYLWGKVGDDLRKTTNPESGFFLNITSQF